MSSSRRSCRSSARPGPARSVLLLTQNRKNQLICLSIEIISSKLNIDWNSGHNWALTCADPTRDWGRKRSGLSHLGAELIDLRTGCENIGAALIDACTARQYLLKRGDLGKAVEGAEGGRQGSNWEQRLAVSVDDWIKLLSYWLAWRAKRGHVNAFD